MAHFAREFRVLHAWMAVVRIFGMHALFISSIVCISCSYVQRPYPNESIYAIIYHPPKPHPSRLPPASPQALALPSSPLLSPSAPSPTQLPIASRSLHSNEAYIPGGPMSIGGVGPSDQVVPANSSPLPSASGCPSTDCGRWSLDRLTAGWTCTMILSNHNLLLSSHVHDHLINLINSQGRSHPCHCLSSRYTHFTLITNNPFAGNDISSVFQHAL